MYMDSGVLLVRDTPTRTISADGTLSSTRPSSARTVVSIASMTRKNSADSGTSPRGGFDFMMEGGGGLVANGTPATPEAPDRVRGARPMAVGGEEEEEEAASIPAHPHTGGSSGAQKSTSVKPCLLALASAAFFSSGRLVASTTKGESDPFAPPSSHAAAAIAARSTSAAATMASKAAVTRRGVLAKRYTCTGATAASGKWPRAARTLWAVDSPEHSLRTTTGGAIFVSFFALAPPPAPTA
mmetsp:Transcript_5122/g.13022  ORF Transcript_5122/g.13022 Transcript_5122/m.13022 type:complete len:241 (+) Transcript_5122:124-846(+)